MADNEKKILFFLMLFDVLHIDIDLVYWFLCELVFAYNISLFHLNNLIQLN